MWQTIRPPYCRHAYQVAERIWTYIVAAYLAISGSKTSYVLSNWGSGVKHNSWKCLCDFQGNICACNCSKIREIDHVTSFVHDLRQCTKTTACFVSVSLLTINMYSKLAFICKQLTITRKTVLCFLFEWRGRRHIFLIAQKLQRKINL